jgi:hypothetical protein
MRLRPVVRRPLDIGQSPPTGPPRYRHLSTLRRVAAALIAIAAGIQAVQTFGYALGVLSRLVQ